MVLPSSELLAEVKKKKKKKKKDAFHQFLQTMKIILSTSTLCAEILSHLHKEMLEVLKQI